MNTPAMQARLSARQAQCLALIAQGFTDPAIAAALSISETTVRYHVDQARRKLGAATRAHAVAMAVAQGLVDIEPAT